MAQLTATEFAVASAARVCIHCMSSFAPACCKLACSAAEGAWLWELSTADLVGGAHNPSSRLQRSGEIATFTEACSDRYATKRKFATRRHANGALFGSNWSDA